MLWVRLLFPALLRHCLDRPLKPGGRRSEIVLSPSTKRIFCFTQDFTFFELYGAPGLRVIRLGILPNRFATPGGALSLLAPQHQSSRASRSQSGRRQDFINDSPRERNRTSPTHWHPLRIFIFCHFILSLMKFCFYKYLLHFSKLYLANNDSSTLTRLIIIEYICPEQRMMILADSPGQPSPELPAPAAGSDANFETSHRPPPVSCFELRLSRRISNP